MTVECYSPCDVEDGDGAPCGYCSANICCYEHWKTQHAPQCHAVSMAEDDKRMDALLKKMKAKENK